MWSQVTFLHSSLMKFMLLMDFGESALVLGDSFGGAA